MLAELKFKYSGIFWANAVFYLCVCVCVGGIVEKFSKRKYMGIKAI